MWIEDFEQISAMDLSDLTKILLKNNLTTENPIISYYSVLIADEQFWHVILLVVLFSQHSREYNFITKGRGEDVTENENVLGIQSEVQDSCGKTIPEKYENIFYIKNQDEQNFTSSWTWCYWTRGVFQSPTPNVLKPKKDYLE